MYEQILAELATAQAVWSASRQYALPAVIAKVKAVDKAFRLINHLDSTLDLERGREVAATCTLYTATCSPS